MDAKLLSLGTLGLGMITTALVAAHGCSGSESNSTGASATSGTPGQTTDAATGAGGSTGPGGSGGSGGGLVSPGSNVDCSPPSGAVGKLKLTKLAPAFTWPIHAVSPVGDKERFFVIERHGFVQLVKGGQKTQFLDISGKVRYDGEYGLLGLAFHPDYVKNGRFFVHYSAKANGYTTLEEYRRDPNNLDVADPNPVGPALLRVEQPYSNHDGGSLEFSPKDGFLYLGLGDGGSGCDPQGFGQNMKMLPNKKGLLGKMVRIDISTNPYKIPPGNMPGGEPEIWDSGLRNPFRFNFDSCTGDLYIGDVGQHRWEEINVEPAG
jgi:glucose/arabinose dehydrogenase